MFSLVVCFCNGVIKDTVFVFFKRTPLWEKRRSRDIYHKAKAFISAAAWALGHCFQLFLASQKGPPLKEVGKTKEQFCGKGEALLWLRGGHTKNNVFLFLYLKWYLFKHIFSVMNSSSALYTKGKTFPEKNPRI